MNMDSAPSPMPDSIVPDSIVPNLDAYRPNLTVLARGQIPVSMQARLDASDIVQETLLEAYRKRDQFQGGQEAKQLAGWLRQLLSCNLIDALRTQRRDQRDVRREQMLPQSVDESAMGLDALLIANDSSPSEAVDKRFRALEVARAIEQLPEHQRDAILLRYFQKTTLEEIASHMQKSKPAVAGLLKRGLASLRERLKKEDG